jgi:RING finger/CCCH-type zinc finger protein
LTEVVAYNMVDIGHGLEACRIVVAGLVEFMRVHGGKGTSPAQGVPPDTKYKVSLCRDLALRGTCPRGTNCTFAHSGDELDK